MTKSVFAARRSAGFTLVELLTVMTIIGILAGLVLGTFKLVQDKGNRSRADSEIRAMETALESFKVDNGDYPRNSKTDALDPRAKGKPSDYADSCLILYRALSGDTDLNRELTNADGTRDIYGDAINPPPTTPAPPKSYYQFKPNLLSPAGGTGTVTSMVDPWGNSYGYSTAYQDNSAKGYNPTFDLWSTGGTTSTTSPPDQAKWLKNW